MKRERTDLGAHIELPSEEARMARVWSGIERKLDHRPTRLRSAGWALAGATAVASMVGVAVWWPGSEAGPLEVDRFASPEMGLTSLSDKGGSLGWSDGSRVEMTEATQLELLENTGERVTFLLHRGEARFRIVPGGPRRWVVEMGDLSVEVLGTVFVVKRSVAGAELVVEQGRVLARSDRLPNRVRRIEAQSPGARLFLPRAPTEERPSPPAAAEPQPRPSPEKAPRPPPPSAAPRRLDDGPPKTSPRAESKIRPRPAQSASTVEARGSPDLKPRGGSATPLPSFASRMEAADEARRAHRLEMALEHLTAAAALDHPEAGLASYTRARLLAELGRRQEARKAFRRAIQQGVPEAMTEQARRRIEALRDEPPP